MDNIEQTFKSFGDYIIFADESGDENLKTINDQNPYFVLSFCIFKVSDYLKTKDTFSKFKFKYFGHDETILHAKDIRDGIGEFIFLNKSDKLKEDFTNEIFQIIENSNFTIISICINKKSLVKQYVRPYDPYTYAIQLAYERISKFIQKNVEGDSKDINIILEARNKNQNTVINNFSSKFIEINNLNFHLRLVFKSHNSIGLQIADYISGAVSQYNRRMNMDNSRLQPFHIYNLYPRIINKFDSDNNGNFIGWGLKFVP